MIRLRLSEAIGYLLTCSRTMLKSYAKGFALLIMAIGAGCASPKAKLPRSVDASVTVALPTLEQSSKPYVVLGLVTLKGHQRVEAGELIRGLAAGDYRGKAVFSPPVFLNSKFEGRYVSWESMEVLNGYTEVTSGGKTETRPRFAKDRQGFEFTLSYREPDVRQLSLVAKVPTWRETIAVEAITVPHTWSLHWGELVDIKTGGWKVLRQSKSPDEVNVGTEVILVYLNRP